MIRVKTIREEFNAAEGNGYVYGVMIKRKNFPVYVELGIEEDYRYSPSDNINTRYRFFNHCNIFVAETDEQLDREEYLTSMKDESVTICC